MYRFTSSAFQDTFTAKNEAMKKKSAMNTSIIARVTDTDNHPGYQRLVYRYKTNDKKVYKSSAKREQLHLRERRVANGPLFNNDTLIQPRGESSRAEVTVGLLHMGAERSYNIPIVWRKDYRGNHRRHITIKDFRLLPVELQETAIAMGVDVSGKIVTFSRCVAAWAGHTVTDMHVHHVNMDTEDDRLGNLHVLTPKEHASIHADKTDLIWDEDWFEYTSYSYLLLRIGMHLLSDEHIAEDIIPPHVPNYMYSPPIDQYFVDAPGDDYGLDGDYPCSALIT